MSSNPTPEAQIKIGDTVETPRGQGRVIAIWANRWQGVTGYKVGHPPGEGQGKVIRYWTREELVLQG